MANGLPNWVILQPFRCKTVIPSAEEWSAPSLITGTKCDTISLSEVMHLLGKAEPSWAEAETVRNPDITEARTVPDAVIASQTLSHVDNQIKNKIWYAHYIQITTPLTYY